jgi:hypothetical protein
VGLLRPLAVHEKPTVPELYHLLRKTYDALYQRLFPAVGALEKDDVPAPGFFEILSELVDQSPVPHLECRDHALRPDVERARDDGRAKLKTSVKEFRSMTGSSRRALRTLPQRSVWGYPLS